MGALEAPQDKHGQEHRTGTSRAEQTDKGGHGGAGSSGGHGSAGSSGGHGRWSMWPWPRSPRPGPYNRNPFTPAKNFPGEVRGYQEPSRARHRQTGQDIPQEPLPPPRQGGRRLEWPPWPQQEEPPAPDESPWTRHDKVR